MESIKDGTNKIGPMQVSEPVRTKNMEKTRPQVWLNSGLERKLMIEPCGWLKTTFSTPTRNSWKQPQSLKTIKGTHQEIIADIEENQMRWGLDSSKAVKKVLPKHKHQFEKLIEYKSDDEDDSDADAESLEDKTTVTI